MSRFISSLERKAPLLIKIVYNRCCVAIKLWTTIEVAWSMSTYHGVLASESLVQHCRCRSLFLFCTAFCNSSHTRKHLGSRIVRCNPWRFASSTPNIEFQASWPKWKWAVLCWDPKPNRPDAFEFWAASCGLDVQHISARPGASRRKGCCVPQAWFSIEMHFCSLQREIKNNDIASFSLFALESTRISRLENFYEHVSCHHLHLPKYASPSHAREIF